MAGILKNNKITLVPAEFSQVIASLVSKLPKGENSPFSENGHFLDTWEITFFIISVSPTIKHPKRQLPKMPAELKIQVRFLLGAPYKTCRKAGFFVRE